MNGLNRQLTDALHHLEEEGLLRRLVPIVQTGGERIADSGRNYLNLSGNDYLGLAADSRLVSEFYRGIREEDILEKFAPGAAASRLMSGNSILYEKLENMLSLLYGTERALVFNSGYHGNAGILPALAEKGDLIIADKLCHASLIDGMRLSRAEYVRYAHLDYDHLAAILEQKRNRYRQVFLVSESVFSMDGDLADLHRLIGLKEQYDCVIYLDEAHAVGVYGQRGLGLAEQEGVAGDIDLLFGTFGKAMAGLGGFVACSGPVADYLVNRARSLIYSTALPPVILNWLLFVLDRLPDMADRRTRLLEMAANLRRALTGEGLTTAGSSQIIPVIIGNSGETLTVAEKLRTSGYWVTAVRPPTVPANTSRLRLSLSNAFAQADLAPLPGLIKNALGG